MQLSDALKLSEQNDVKVCVYGQLVKKLFHIRNDRGMTVIEFGTRCVRQGEVHELVTTTHRNLAAGDRVDDVGFLGFIEIQNAGIIEKGDLVYARGELVGTVSGFDDCHFPNHYNILIETERLLSANALTLTLKDEFAFVSSPNIPTA